MSSSKQPSFRLFDCVDVVRSHLRTWLWLNRRWVEGKARSVLAMIVSTA